MGDFMLLNESCKEIIIDVLIKELDPYFIYLFGSYAKGEARDDSDIDLAVYTEMEKTSYELFLLANKLALFLKKDVEIINLKQISTVFAAQIVGTGEVLYSKDDYMREEFAMLTFKKYAKLNEERKVILDSIREDGSIYGK